MLVQQAQSKMNMKMKMPGIFSQQAVGFPEKYNDAVEIVAMVIIIHIREHLSFISHGDVGMRYLTQ